MRGRVEYIGPPRDTYLGPFCPECGGREVRMTQAELVEGRTDMLEVGRSLCLGCGFEGPDGKFEYREPERVERRRSLFWRLLRPLRWLLSKFRRH